MSNEAPGQLCCIVATGEQILRQANPERMGTACRDRIVEFLADQADKMFVRCALRGALNDQPHRRRRQGLSPIMHVVRA
jgi:hypothetical protein